MLKTNLIGVAAIVATLGLSGCWESADVTVHEAGKYMGAKDELLATSGASRAEGLKKRFQLVQVDR
jgi:hypothetical protein